MQRPERLAAIQELGHSTERNFMSIPQSITQAEAAVLSLSDLEALALEHNLELSGHYPATMLKGLEPPRPVSLRIRFSRVAPEAWRILMTRLTEIPVSIHNTRRVTGSGATDNSLYPEYEVLRDEVNKARSQIGLGLVYG